MTKKLFFFLFIILLFLSSKAQVYNRVEAAVSVKTKYENGKGSLEMGMIYYDKRNKKLVYDFSFPEKQTILIGDTSISIVKNGAVVNHAKTISLIQSTLFNVILTGELSNFGLRNNSIYKVLKVEKDKDMVVTTWTPIKKNSMLGNVLVSTKGKDLNGVVTYSAKGEVVSKQIFSKYIVVSGLKFPTEITQVIFQDQKKIYQVTTFKKIIVNSLQNEKFYNYTLPRK